MNKYKWNYNKLRINLGILEHIYEEVDESVKSDIKSMIDMYKNMLRLANKKRDSFSDFDDSLSNYNMIDLIKEINSYYLDSIMIY